MPLSDDNVQAIQMLFAEELGERPDGGDLVALLEALDDDVDDAGQLDQAVCRDAIRRYLRRTRQCEHSQPQPGHPGYEGERCPSCDALEYGDRRCDERRGT